MSDGEADLYIDRQMCNIKEATTFMRSWRSLNVEMVTLGALKGCATMPPGGN